MQNKKLSPLSKHLIVEFLGARNLSNAEQISIALNAAAQLAGAKVIASKIHNFGDGQGVTGVVLLAESHISIHTWPEYSYAAIDVFMCGDAEPERVIEHLKTVFNPSKVEIRTLKRGESVDQSNFSNA